MAAGASARCECARCVDVEDGATRGPYLRLSDTEYALAARLSLGMRPFPPQARTLLPRDCPLCKRHVSLDADPGHCLTCKHTTIEQMRRHDAVVDAISRVTITGVVLCVLSLYSCYSCVVQLVKVRYCVTAHQGVSLSVFCLPIVCRGCFARLIR